MQWISKLWRGEYSLCKTFWLFGFLIYAGLFFALPVVALHNFVMYIIMSFLYTVYLVIVIVGLWRASDKYAGRYLWSVLAKAWCVLASTNVIAMAAVILFGFK